MPYVKDGTLRALGVARNRRTPLMADLPAFSEDKSLGLERYNAAMWFSIMTTANTPKPEVDKLNAALNDALKNPEVEKKLTDMGFEISRTTPDELGKILARDLEQWIRVAKENNLSAKN
jgi:tripartite-type tricarboxylate transporter receptor subunit TctC